MTTQNSFKAVYLAEEPNGSVSETGKVVSTETPKVSDEVLSPNVTPTETPKSEVEPKTFTKEYVEELRAEAARHRVEKQKERADREALEAKVKEYEDAQLSESEKVTRDFEEAKTKATSYEQKVRELSLNYELAMAARDEKIADVKAAVKLADRELIEYDSAGNITNLPAVIENLKSTYSSLFSKSASAPNTGVTNPAKAPSAKKWTREDLRTLSPEKRKELMDSGALNELLGRS